MLRRTLQGLKPYPRQITWSGGALSFRAHRQVSRRISHFSDSGRGSWKADEVIRDLQRTRLYRSEQFAKLQLRRLSFITRLGLWVRRNFTTLAHLACLGLGAWAFLDTTQLVSTLLLGLSAINLHKWLTLIVGQAVGYQLGLDVTIEKIIPKWKKNVIRLVGMKLVREKQDALLVNGAIIDMELKEIDVKLSLSHALTGCGFLKEISISGITGVFDRRTTIWTEEMQANYSKRQPHESDFKIDSVKVKDLAMTIYQSNPPRPLELTIFNLKLPRLRVHWLLYDIFDAETVHGKFDNCLFSVENEGIDQTTQTRKNHFTIAGLDFDLVSTSYPQGILSWITQGFMDIDCYYEMPLNVIDERALEYNPTLMNKYDYSAQFKMALSLNNINISLPNIASNDISITNYAMVQPIVAYFNTNYVKVPLQLDFRIPMDDFSGSWYPGDANLYDAISNSTYEEVLRLIAEQKKYRRARELVMMGLEGCYRGVRHFLTQTWYFITEHV